MKGYEILAFMIAASLIINSAAAQYWFQFGATGDQAAYYNTGAGVTIKTAQQPGVSDGSMGFWAGENLANGAFIQTGYVIENQSGSYPSYCTISKCTGYEYLKKGDAEWFYEYFEPGSNSSGFLGALGPDASAGTNGTINRYSFYYSQGNWHFLFNGNEIGSVDLGTGSSGTNAPVAFGELANTSSNNEYIAPVEFTNLSFYNEFGSEMPLPKGYSYIGYGIGSDKSLQNPYSVSEVGQRVNYFQVGSGLNQSSNGYELWSLGYHLRTVSKYGTGNSNASYRAYATEVISEPEYVYINNGTRAKFTGWVGTGSGSYTGASNVAQVSMSSNITEYAGWQVQYLFTVNSSYGQTNGTGWYESGSTAYYAISNSTVYENSSARFAFEGWSNGNRNTSGTVSITAPYSVNTSFSKEYYVSAHAAYGNLTGTGWYKDGAPAAISITGYIANKTVNSRSSFYAWDNGSATPYLSFIVHAPVNITAIFKSQYLVQLDAIDAYGNEVFPSNIYIDNSPVNTTTFLFSGTNYTVNGAYYKGTYIKLDQAISANSRKTIFISLPIYNINLTATDMFGMPANATVYLNFANGTSRYLQLGSSGRAAVSEVPYGYLNISATYSGLTEHASTDSGSNIKLTFVSIYDIAAFAAIIVLAFLLYFASKSIMHGPGASKRQKL